ncbi:hypothetical protein, partial [Corynebacterium mastitidis]|uniref:hypothetical protein n=1 Tax=Corynebacterium mastitidis TaxID=161890 RepID=UPI001B7FCF5D
MDIFSTVLILLCSTTFLAVCVLWWIPTVKMLYAIRVNDIQFKQWMLWDFAVGQLYFIIIGALTLSIMGIAAG